MNICKWCGKPLRKKYNSQKYHKKCEKEARKEQIMFNKRNFSRKYKNQGIQTFDTYKKNLGTGLLSSKTKILNSDENTIKEERNAIINEMNRLGLI